MRRPWRRYCLYLSLRLKLPLPQLLTTLSSADIAEYMAFDMTQSPDWLKAYEQQQLAEQAARESVEHTVERFKKLSKRIGRN